MSKYQERKKALKVKFSDVTQAQREAKRRCWKRWAPRIRALRRDADRTTKEGRATFAGAVAAMKREAWNEMQVVA